MTDSQQESLPSESFIPPRGACDCHCHIVGPIDRFPVAPSRRGGHVHDAPKEKLFAQHDELGVDRAVVVHSAMYGTDMSVTLDALACAPKRLRGVALVELDISDQRLDELHAAGVRGVRRNLVSEPNGPSDPNAFIRLSERIAERGWHILLHMNPEQIFSLGDLLKALRAPLVFDHLMRLDPSQTLDQPAVERLRAFVDKGAWVKIASVDKGSRQPYPHMDFVELARFFVRLAPERVIWGSDWPHPDGRGMRGGVRPDDRRLLQLTSLYAPDPSDLLRLLVSNPARLYGFDPI